METKICGECKEEKPLDCFYKSKRDGWQSRCKDCRRVESKLRNRMPYRRAYNKVHYRKLVDNGYFKEYNQRPEVKNRKATQMREYLKLPKYIKMSKARRLVRTSKKNGTLVQQPCCCCGVKKTEAHHSDYDIPLLVVWLCPDCHRKEHVKLNAKAEGKE